MGTKKEADTVTDPAGGPEEKKGMPNWLIWKKRSSVTHIWPFL